MYSVYSRNENPISCFLEFLVSLYYNPKIQYVHICINFNLTQIIVINSVNLTNRINKFLNCNIDCTQYLHDIINMSKIKD